MPVHTQRGERGIVKPAHAQQRQRRITGIAATQRIHLHPAGTVYEPAVAYIQSHMVHAPRFLITEKQQVSRLKTVDIALINTAPYPGLLRGVTGQNSHLRKIRRLGQSGAVDPFLGGSAP